MLLSVLNKLTELTGNPCFQLRLCVASRAENIFKNALQNCPCLIIHLHTTRDIETYAEGKIQRERGTRLTHEGENILSELIQKYRQRSSRGLYVGQTRR